MVGETFGADGVFLRGAEEVVFSSTVVTVFVEAVHRDVGSQHASPSDGVSGLCESITRQAGAPIAFRERGAPTNGFPAPH